MPPNLSFEEGASVPLGIATATTGLFGTRTDPGSKKLNPFWETGEGQYAGQPIVILGGSSSVGQYSE